MQIAQYLLETRAKEMARYLNIRSDDSVCENMLFVYDILGCDTTSHVSSGSKKVQP